MDFFTNQLAEHDGIDIETVVGRGEIAGKQAGALWNAVFLFRGHKRSPEERCTGGSLRLC